MSSAVHSAHPSVHPHQFPPYAAQPREAYASGGVASLEGLTIISAQEKPLIGDRLAFPFYIPATTTESAILPLESSLTVDGRPVGTPLAAVLNPPHRAQWIQYANDAERLLEIVCRFLYIRPDDQFSITGRDYLKNVISRHVDRMERITIVFPAFPFKSPSAKKVLGSKPDLGEELLLRRLETLARSIEDFYPPGAVIRIVSDGVVYGEILQRSDAAVYQYNAALRDMTRSLGLTHISFVRVADLLDDTGVVSEDVMTEQEYVDSIPLTRSRFLAHSVANYDLDHALKHDHGTLMTYRGYLRFLIADLEGSNILCGADGKKLSGKAQERVRRVVARQMLENGAKFSDLVARKFPDAVRISCHAHDNAGPKYAFNMFPGAPMAVSPWHNAMLMRNNGTFALGHYSSFDPSTFDVVFKDGFPYYLREKSADYDFGPLLTPHLTVEQNHPFGLIIKADPSAKISFNDLPMAKIRALSTRFSALLLRGFVGVSREDFITKSTELGSIVTWPKFGAILELKENPHLDMNSSLTCESMPMHYDGVFKTKRDSAGNLTHDPPQFQVFQCIEAPSQGEGGQTLLTNTAELLKHGLTPDQKAWLSKATYTVFTPQNQVFGGELLRLPLVMRNAETGHDILRWHEHWPQSVTRYNCAEARVNGVSPHQSRAIGDLLTDLLYDRRFCYAHTWVTGDFLIADNVEMMHTRTAFKPSPRELWRIHVN